MENSKVWVITYSFEIHKNYTTEDNNTFMTIEEKDIYGIKEYCLTKKICQILNCIIKMEFEILKFNRYY